MRWRRKWWNSRLEVRFVGDGGSEPADFVPSVASDHDRLLAILAAQQPTWSTQALRTLLEGVRDGHGFEDIAVVDAWTHGAEAFCVTYTPPWFDHLVGVRRERGDGGDFGENMPDDPAAFAVIVLDDLSEPLGRRSAQLRYDANGMGWWGTLAGQLPERPHQTH